jgi:hypothetical protein
LEGQYAPAQQQESATAVHLPFKEFEPVYLAFDLPVAPALFYRRNHSIVITLDSGNEALQFRDLRLQTAHQPRLERVGIPILEHLAELLSQFFGRGDLRMSRGDCLHRKLLFRGALLRRLRQPKGDPSQVGQCSARLRRLRR